MLTTFLKNGNNGIMGTKEVGISDLNQMGKVHMYAPNLRRG